MSSFRILLSETRIVLPFTYVYVDNEVQFERIPAKSIPPDRKILATNLHSDFLISENILQVNFLNNLIYQ